MSEQLQSVLAPSADAGSQQVSRRDALKILSKVPLAIKAVEATAIAAFVGFLEAACTGEVVETKFIPTSDNLDAVVTSVGDYDAAYESEITDLSLDQDGQNLQLDLTEITTTGHGVTTGHGIYTLNRYRATFSDGNTYPLYEVVNITNMPAEYPYKKVLAQALQDGSASRGNILKIVGYVRPATPYSPAEGYQKGINPKTSYFLISRLATKADVGQ